MREPISRYGIAHVGYVVADSEAAVKRLSMLYDIQDWLYVEFKPLSAVNNGVETDKCYLRCVLSLPDKGTRLEVIEPVSEGVHMDILREGVQTISHICHVVDDYESCRDAWLAKETNLVFEAELEDKKKGYLRCCYVYDPVLKTLLEISGKWHFREGTVGKL